MVQCPRHGLFVDFHLVTDYSPYPLWDRAFDKEDGLATGHLCDRRRHFRGAEFTSARHVHLREDSDPIHGYELFPMVADAREKRQARAEMR